ncbi:hypothetical protein L9F63_011177, partial [Diploptera punctata]
MRQYNVGVLMASRLDSPFDLERAGPAVDMALELVNDKFLRQFNVSLHKVQARALIIRGNVDRGYLGQSKTRITRAVSKTRGKRIVN